MDASYICFKINCVEVEPCNSMCHQKLICLPNLLQVCGAIITSLDIAIHIDIKSSKLKLYPRFQMPDLTFGTAPGEALPIY